MPRKAKRRPPTRQPEQSSHVQEEAVQAPSDRIQSESIPVSEERLDDINRFIETKNKSDRHAVHCTERLHGKLAECQEFFECCVCLERPVCFVISPCGHCVCGHEKCGSANLQECPVCRGGVNHMTKMFGPVCAISNTLDMCQKLTEQISVSHAEASSLESPFMALALQWRIRFDQVSGLEREVSGLRKDNDELNSTVGEKCLDIYHYKNQLTAMEDKALSLRNAYAASLAAAKEKTERKCAEIEALSSESRLLKEDLAEANEKLERSSQAIEAMEELSLRRLRNSRQANEELSSALRQLKQDLADSDEGSQRLSQVIEALSSELCQLKAEHAASVKEKEEWKLSIMHRTHWMLWKFNKFKEKHAWLKHANRYLAKQLQKSKARGDRGQASSCNDRPTVEEEMSMRSSLTSSIDRDIDTSFKMSALSERAFYVSQTDSAGPRKSRHTPDCSAHCLKVSKRETPCLKNGF